METDMRTLEPMAGTHIRDVLQQAVEEATEHGQPVRFSFNEMELTVSPGEDYETAKTRWEDAHGRRVLSREEELQRIEEDLERREREYEAARQGAGVESEQEMREADVPWPEGEEELLEYIAALVDRPHDYGTCVYAMSMSAVAAFRYVAKELGVTGFQAGCADMDILRRTRRMEHGFRVVDYANLLYPQYWDEERTPIFEAAINEAPEVWAERARERLEKMNGGHPRVRDHLERISRSAGP